MGVVLKRFPTYDYKFVDIDEEEVTIHFVKDIPICGLPLLVENHLLHETGYFGYAPEDRKPYLDLKENAYMKVDWKGVPRTAIVQDWRNYVACENLEVRFGAPRCNKDQSERPLCPVCLEVNGDCIYPMGTIPSQQIYGNGGNIKTIGGFEGYEEI